MLGERGARTCPANENDPRGDKVAICRGGVLGMSCREVPYYKVLDLGRIPGDFFWSLVQDAEFGIDPWRFFLVFPGSYFYVHFGKW